MRTQQTDGRQTRTGTGAPVGIQGAASSSGTTEGTTTERASGTPARRSFWSGRSELIRPVLVAGLATWLAYETATMTVLGTSVPGPQFFPTIVCVLLFAVALVHVGDGGHPPHLLRPVERTPKG